MLLHSNNSCRFAILQILSSINILLGRSSSKISFSVNSIETRNTDIGFRRIGFMKEPH